MKSIMLSIKPKNCELIASGIKTIEARKTAPTLMKPPFKCYIYCTKNGDYMVQSKTNPALYKNHINKYGGKVIGEFICDKLVWVVSHPTVFAGIDTYHKKAIEDACLSEKEAEKYANGKDVYGWHISDLVIYDEPKELGEFYKKCEPLHCDDCKYLKCKRINENEYDLDCSVNEHIPITNPPQSWCYVEESA